MPAPPPAEPGSSYAGADRTSTGTSLMNRTDEANSGMIIRFDDAALQEIFRHLSYKETI